MDVMDLGTVKPSNIPHVLRALLIFSTEINGALKYFTLEKMDFLNNNKKFLKCKLFLLFHCPFQTLSSQLNFFSYALPKTKTIFLKNPLFSSNMSALFYTYFTRQIWHSIHLHTLMWAY